MDACSVPAMLAVDAVHGSRTTRPLTLGLFWFPLHQAAVYLLAEYGIVALSAQIHNVVLPVLQIPSPESRLQFLFNHFPMFCAICGIVIGGVAASYRHRSALMVWLLPAVILGYELAIFPAGLYQDHWALASRHYFAGGFLIPEFQNFKEMFRNWNSDNSRGIDQLRFTAPFYVGVAYSIGCWLGERLGIRIPMLGSPFLESKKSTVA
jgi:hypothetical protein